MLYDQETLGSSGLKNTKSGGGEQSLLLGCKAKAPIKGGFVFTDAGINNLIPGGNRFTRFLTRPTTVQHK